MKGILIITLTTIAILLMMFWLNSASYNGEKLNKKEQKKEIKN